MARPRGLFLAAFLVVLASCGSASADGQPPPRPIEAEAAQLDDVVQRIAVVGRLEADQQVSVNPELPERIAAVHVELGQQVEAGDPLVTLSGEVQAGGFGQARASLEAAQASRALAATQLERVKILHQAGTASKAELDAAISQLESAEAQVRQLGNAVSQAAVQRDRSVVRAPIAGVVAKLDAHEGDIATPGRPLVVVVQPGGMKAELDVPERNFLKVEAGMPARVSLLADPSVVAQGQVTAVGALVAADTRTGDVEVALPEPPLQMVAGAAVRVEIEIARRAGVLMVPIQAVQLAADVAQTRKGTVFVVSGDTASAREVVVGHREAERIEIVDGLEPGEVIATLGAHLLRDGARVTVVDGSER